MTTQTIPELKCKSVWASEGLVPLAGESPKEVRPRYGGGEVHLYSREQMRPKRIVRHRPPEQVDLLAAIFAMTRAAKRFRDAAAACYESGAFNFATGSAIMTSTPKFLGDFLNI